MRSMPTSAGCCAKPPGRPQPPECAWGRPLPRPAELSGSKGEESIKVGITAHSASHPRNGSERKMAYPGVVPTARGLTLGHDPAPDQANSVPVLARPSPNNGLDPKKE